jgi:antitoxin HicB
MSTKTTKYESLEYYMNLKYPVTIHVAPEGGFVAEIEELPCCFAQG